MSNHDARSDPPSRGDAANAAFHTTHWSVVLLAAREDSPAAMSALEQLCRTYWYPLYAYARRQGHSPPDGQDLTQQFFAVFLEKKYFGLANPERGRFRSFLLASFKHFLANDYHRRHTAKRGGRFTFVSVDDTTAEARFRNEPACHASPDKHFEETWALTLLEKVLQDLREEYIRAGKGNLFRTLEVFLSGDRAEATYAEVGSGLQMSEAAVKMAVSRLRGRYGQMLRREIAHTLTGPTTVEEELRHLIGALSR